MIFNTKFIIFHPYTSAAADVAVEMVLDLLVARFGVLCQHAL